MLVTSLLQKEKFRKQKKQLQNCSCFFCSPSWAPFVSFLALDKLLTQSGKKKASAFADAFFAPPIIQSCSTISSFDEPLALDDIQFSFLNNT